MIHSRYLLANKLTIESSSFWGQGERGLGLKTEVKLLWSVVASYSPVAGLLLLESEDFQKRGL